MKMLCPARANDSCGFPSYMENHTMNARAKHYQSGGSAITKAVPSEQPVDLHTGKFCYVIIETSKDENGYIPCIAIEDDESLYPMLGRGRCATPWYWGHTMEHAEKVAREVNRRMGVTLEREFKITASSMRAALRQWGRRGGR
jgi:hypothetical protein